MSKAVLMSIQPKWVELILNGKKTIEVRKTAPKLETPFKVYVYCSYGNKKENYMLGKTGKVVAEFMVDMIEPFTPTEKGIMFERFSALYETCLSVYEIRKYADGNTVYGWHVSDLKIYDQPKELREFDLAICNVSKDIACDECPYYEWNSVLHSCRKRRITRPPQSWCYVE